MNNIRTVSTDTPRLHWDVEAKPVKIPDGMTALEAMKADAKIVRRKNAHINQLEQRGRQQSQQMQERQDAVEAYLADKRVETARQIAAGANIPFNAVRHLVARMVAQGVLKKSGAGHNTKYEVAE